MENDTAGGEEQMHKTSSVMRVPQRIIGSVILSAAALACSGNVADQGTDAEHELELGSQTEALSPYTKQVSNTAQSIVFTGPAGTQWVDVHFKINGARNANVRMEAQANGSFSVSPLAVVAGDVLTYSFTYFANGVATDTPVFSHTFPNPWTPPAFRTTVSGSKLRALSTRALAWADAHYRVNGGPQLNVRMQAVSGGFETPVALKAGDTLSYWLTYSPGSYVFDTAQTSYLVPGGAATTFTVDKSADSTTGSCTANASSAGNCNLRAAFAAAESAVQPVTIALDVPSTIDQGQILISGAAPGYSVTVQSVAHAQTISSGGFARLLWLSAGSLKLQNVVISGFKDFDGGAIVNHGDLSLSGVTLSNNTTSCTGVGAMTSFVSCNGGAVANYSNLTIGGGTKFTNNSVLAQSSTAAFTNATASGGAILSSGSLLLNGPVTFTGNVARAEATSGIHPGPGGASAASSGGAISNLGGSVTVSGAAVGNCIFQSNTASGLATAPSPFTGTLSTAGGAISSSGGSVTIPAGACTFSDNHADVDPDLHIVP